MSKNNDKARPESGDDLSGKNLTKTRSNSEFSSVVDESNSPGVSFMQPASPLGSSLGKNMYTSNTPFHKQQCLLATTWGKGKNNTFRLKPLLAAATSIAGD